MRIRPVRGRGAGGGRGFCGPAGRLRPHAPGPHPLPLPFCEGGAQVPRLLMGTSFFYGPSSDGPGTRAHGAPPARGGTCGGRGAGGSAVQSRSRAGFPRRRRRHRGRLGGTRVPEVQPRGRVCVWGAAQPPAQPPSPLPSGCRGRSRRAQRCLCGWGAAGEAEAPLSESPRRWVCCVTGGRWVGTRLSGPRSQTCRCAGARRGTPGPGTGPRLSPGPRSPRAPPDLALHPSGHLFCVENETETVLECVST